MNTPQQQESMTTEKQSDWTERFDVHFPCLVKPTSYTFTKNGEKQEVETMTYEKDAVMAFIASELQAERTRLIAEVEVWLDKMPIYEIDDAPLEFCAGYNECVSVWQTYVLELKSNLTALKKEEQA